MVMGGEIYLPGYEAAWKIGRELGPCPSPFMSSAPSACSQPSTSLARRACSAKDNIFIHMTGMSDDGWKYAADAGAHVSLSVPIEMHMRHGTPPIQQAIDLGMDMSLSTDVECTMTADFFTQMRSLVTLQRMFANEKALSGQDYPELMTLHGGDPSGNHRAAPKGLKLDRKVGSLTPGKEADIILLDAEAINVAPLNNVPGAVVTLMERTMSTRSWSQARSRSGRARFWASTSTACAESLKQAATICSRLQRSSATCLPEAIEIPIPATAGIASRKPSLRANRKD
jgi:5-methylthioadenosine/S-adenosylhomocysteine deaminase